LTGGTGLVLGALSGIVGGIVGKRKRDSRFNADRINQIAVALTPGSSAIVAVIEHNWVAELEREMEQAGADVMTAAISADIAEQLAQNRDVAYSALATATGLETSRVAAGEDELQASRTTFTNDAVEHVDVVANEAGVAGRHSIETAEGAVAEGFVVTKDVAVYGASVVTGEGAVGMIAATGAAAQPEAEPEALEPGEPEAETKQPE
jgi:hypothetical protein